MMPEAKGILPPALSASRAALAGAAASAAASATSAADNGLPRFPVTYHTVNDQCYDRKQND